VSSDNYTLSLHDSLPILAQGARDIHLAGFQWLAQCFQHTPVKLGQLIKKQHALVCQRNFPRTWPCTAADHGGGRGGVVWCPERAQEKLAVQARALQRMNRGHFQCLWFFHRRQQTGQATGEHALATAWRSAQQQRVSATGGNLQRASRLELAAHL